MFPDLNAMPAIETERLLLRLPHERDFEPLAAMYADPLVMRFLGGPTSRDMTWRTLATFLGHWCIRGYGLFSVIDKASGDFAGRVGLIHPEGWPALEIGWAIARPYWGQGYATESARAILDREIPRLRPRRLISLVDDENAASARVAQKLGAVKCGMTEFAGSPTRVYAYGLPSNPLAPDASAS